jgi:hypothetical protein
VNSLTTLGGIFLCSRRAFLLFNIYYFYQQTHTHTHTYIYIFFLQNYITMFIRVYFRPAQQTHQNKTFELHMHPLAHFIKKIQFLP